MLSHELIHCLTNSVNLRMKNDADGKTASYIDVQGDLVSYFRFDESKSLGAKNRFSVGNLIAEFSAENYATKALGNQSFSIFYALVRSTGEKLPQLVDEAVFRRAVLGDDPVAYRQVIKAAKLLQEQHAKANLLDEKNKDVAGMQAAQGDTPFGTPLTA